MDSIRRHLAPILDAVVAQSATSFLFQGESFTFSSEAEAQTQLSHLLYDRCYMRRINGALAPPETNGETSLMAELRAANAARPRWQTGWRIDSVQDGGWISAQRDGLNRTFAPGEFATKEGPGMSLRVGALVDVYFAVESLQMQPGFYFAFSETIADEADNQSLLRFYWHLEPSGSALLINVISNQFTRFQVPYRFKCLTHPGAYIRTDSAVLFVPRRWYQIAARLLREARHALAAHLRPDSPLFTKRLADGLAFAEDPGNGQSFGMYRCTALACAIREVAPAQGHSNAANVEEALSRQGVSLRFPYLNPGSVDIYDFVE
jgi:hypothetical protein